MTPSLSWNTNQDRYTAHLLVDGSYLVHRSTLISGSVQLFFFVDMFGFLDECVCGEGARSIFM